LSRGVFGPFLRNKSDPFLTLSASKRPLFLHHPNKWCYSIVQTAVFSTPSLVSVVMSARVCPLPMRRERSDLCASSVMRLARHTERSPGPSVPKRQPLRPPETACDPDMITNCIDELRRRRLQSVNESQLDPSSAGQSSAAAQVSLRERNSRVSGQRTSDDVTGYTPRASRRDHRMSVPNLSPEPSSSVIQSAKALREKLGRNGDGELSVRNSYLISIWVCP
uniref:SPEG complex locus n=1 Tax=Heligmosomoides polygyrus TaxID=6339 RepID=A0A183FTR9_HELPZ